ncbi:MAG: DUF3604 domain-containing protein [Candidatus Lokiarchaeota archaeon]|nr:DUF3604 domain-containing protein [Candidatus Lokiarchaeota archaeon]
MSENKNKSRSLKKTIILILKISLVVGVSLSWILIFIDFNVLINNTYQNLWIKGPSIIEEDEPFYLYVEVWDEYERLSYNYIGEIDIQIESYKINNTVYNPIINTNWTISSVDFTFDRNDNGKKVFNISISTRGIHFFRVIEKNTGEMFRSNPIIVNPRGTDFERLYWGDIHSHTSYSDGSGLPNGVYSFARDVALLDFAALTEHSEIFPQFGTQDLFNKFRNYIDVTNNYNQDGRFTTLIALEWTPLLGNARSYLCNQHMNFYFSGNNMPFFSSFTHFTPDEIYQYLHENLDNNNKYMAWTHHVLREDYGSDYAFYNESINRMIEIFSVHGCGEFVDPNLNPYPTTHSFPNNTHGYSINDALKMGRKFGIMASSDSHDGRMGHPIVHTEARGALHVQPFSISVYKFGSYPGGLTGLFSRNLTRKSVYESLWNRSAYGTSWINRHYLNFSINGVRIGQEDSTVSVADENSSRFLEITVIADGISKKANLRTNISKIEIFKNSELWMTEEVNDIIYHKTIEDNQTITGASYDNCIQKDDGNWYIHERSVKPVDPTTLNTGGADYYYIRMTDSSHGLGWIGPIWVEPVS